MYSCVSSPLLPSLVAHHHLYKASKDFISWSLTVNRIVSLNLLYQKKKKKREREILAFYRIYILPLTIIVLCESQPHCVWIGANHLEERVLKINGSELLGEKSCAKKTHG